MGIVYESNDISEIAMIQSVLGGAGIAFTVYDELHYKRIGGTKIAVRDDQEEEARAIIEDYLQSVSGGSGAKKIVKEAPIYCPECNSKDCVQTFWSMFTNTPKYKCRSCGYKFK